MTLNGPASSGAAAAPDKVVLAFVLVLALLAIALWVQRPKKTAPLSETRPAPAPAPAKERVPDEGALSSLFRFGFADWDIPRTPRTQRATLPLVTDGRNTTAYHTRQPTTAGLPPRVGELLGPPEDTMTALGHPNSVSKNPPIDAVSMDKVANLGGDFYDINSGNARPTGTASGKLKNYSYQREPDGKAGIGSNSYA
jgi:hypothetical protein